MPAPTYIPRTVLELYSDALTDIQVLQPAQTPSGAQMGVVHRKFQDMVRAWSQVRLRLFFIPEAAYPLTAGTGSYAIGPAAANFDTNAGVYTRPVFVQTAHCLIGTARRWPMSILTRPQWEVLPSKTTQDPDGPTDLFYDFNHPISNINVAPVPSQNTTLYLSQWNPLTVFGPGDEQKDVLLYYPEAYLIGLRAGLAIECASAFNRPVTQQLVGVFQGGIQIIEQLNSDKLNGALGLSRTVNPPTKGDGIMLPVGASPQALPAGR